MATTALAGNHTLLDIARANAAAGSDLVVEAITTGRNELAVIPSAPPMDGKTMELEVCTALPTAGFRSFNGGGNSLKGTFETRVFQTAILDEHTELDKRAPEYIKASAREAFLRNRAMPVMESVLELCSKQFWYGTTQDAKGFIGLIAQTNPDTDHVVDAGGTTAGQLSSAWLLCTGQDKLQWLWGNSATVYMDEAWTDQILYDSASKAYPGMINWVHAAPGLKLANKNCAIRIKNLTSQAGKGLTDDLWFSAIKLANKLGMTPTSAWVNPTQRELWRKSRQATNVTGAPAPLPLFVQDNIPLYSSRFIVDGETI